MATFTPAIGRYARRDSGFSQKISVVGSVLVPAFIAGAGATMTPFQTHGERVVFGQRLLQAASDIFLGHFVGGLSNKHFYVRQLRDVKVRPMVETFSAEDMLGFAQNCGWALARAHARSGDPAIIAGYIGKGSALPEAIEQFAEVYADQNQADYERFMEAVGSGLIETQAV